MTLPSVQTQKRREDSRFTTGAGSYTGDLRPEGLLHLVFVRSSHAHARIIKIDAAAAAKAKGVRAIITGADLAAAGLKPIPGGFKVPRPDGQPAPKTDRPSLAIDRVRYAGEAVAAVVANSLPEALAAAELVDVEYEALPAVTSANALEGGAPAVWDTAPDNIAFFWQGGDAAAAEEKLRNAAHVTRLDMAITRVHAAPMENRATLAQPLDGKRLLVQASNQSPFPLRDGLVGAGFEKDSIVIRLGDVGGSFGLKMGLAPEDIVVAFAAKKLKRPVVWESTRSESFIADDHGRGQTATTEIGFDRSNRIVALRVKAHVNLGAYVGAKSGWAINNIGGIAGVYVIPTIHASVCGYLTNMVPSAAYRGAGRPEATYMIERALDVAARELGVSPYELRRKNLIPPKAMPYQTALIFKYDCGEFEGNMEAASRAADLDGFKARRKEAAKRGKLRGIGISNCIEVAGGPYETLAPDASAVALLPDGRLRVHTGTMSVGQGHETTFTQIVAERFGVSIDQVEFRQGDTETVPFGRGNGGSSGVSTGASAVVEAASGLASKLTAMAAERLATAPGSVTLSGGIFRNRDNNRTVSLKDLAASISPTEDGVAVKSEGTFRPPAVTYPNGCHICEVEVDPDTGVVDIVSYSAVEDIGRVMHPMLAEGQIQGGVAQGIGQALGEEIVHDASGQLISGTFMDYQMPRASDLPSYKLGFREVLTKSNPLGVKGVGEAGTVGALAAAMNAVNDALSSAGVRSFDMPATPARVWQALAGAASQRSAKVRK